MVTMTFKSYKKADFDESKFLSELIYKITS